LARSRKFYKSLTGDNRAKAIANRVLAAASNKAPLNIFRQILHSDPCAVPGINGVIIAELVGLCSVLALTVPTMLSINGARAEQPPSPCHPNPNADKDRAAVASRRDVVNLPES
jgi:hypothetical protein